jgi:hypothetical protein
LWLFFISNREQIPRAEDHALLLLFPKWVRIKKWLRVKRDKDSEAKILALPFNHLQDFWEKYPY